MEPQKSGGRSGFRRFLIWTKVVVLVVAITLLLVLILQNIGQKATFRLIIQDWQTSTAAIVTVSFAAGVLLTLLALLLRRGARKP